MQMDDRVLEFYITEYAKMGNLANQTWYHEVNFIQYRFVQFSMYTNIQSQVRNVVSSVVINFLFTVISIQGPSLGKKILEFFLCCKVN
jgi:hypothetical protein